MPDPVGFAPDRFAQNLCQRHTSPTRFALENGEVVGIRGYGGAPASHYI